MSDGCRMVGLPRGKPTGDTTRQSLGMYVAPLLLYFCIRLDFDQLCMGSDGTTPVSVCSSASGWFLFYPRVVSFS